MMQFEDWWEIVITVLDQGRRIRNWTALQGLTVGGEFAAWSYRSLSKEDQSFFNNGYPFESPADWLVCTQVKGEGWVPVPKKEFTDRYGSWRAYRDNKIIRKDFKASPYVIWIFHEFDALISVDFNSPK